MRLRRLISFLLLIIIPIYAWGHVVHVGNVSIPVHSEKYTTPSINFKTANNELYHIPMVPYHISNTIHVLYNNTVYSACSGEKTHIGPNWFIGNCLVDVDSASYPSSPACSGEKTRVGHYLFVGDCLVGSDSNVYLESTGTQYIDTTWTDTNETAVDAKFYIIEASFDYLYGSFQKESPRNVYNGLYYTSVLEYNYSQYNTFPSPDYYVTMSQTITGDSIKIDINGITVTLSIGTVPSTSLYLMALPPQTQTGFNPRIYRGKFRTYYFTIKDGSNVVRNLIPVPAGLQIGNYTVPSNGMWDVVEQKFYANSGTDDFIYGIDQ